MITLRASWIGKEIKSQLSGLEERRKRLPKDPTSRKSLTSQFVTEDGCLRAQMEGGKSLQIMDWINWNSSGGFAVPNDSLGLPQVVLLAGRLSDKLHWITCEFTDACVEKAEVALGRRITDGSRGKIIQLVSYELVVKGCDGARFWKGVTFKSQWGNLQSDVGGASGRMKQSTDDLVQWAKRSAPETIFRVSDFEVICDFNNPVAGNPRPITECKEIMNKILTFPRSSTPLMLLSQESQTRPSDSEDEEAELRSQPASPTVKQSHEGSSFLASGDFSQMQFTTQLPQHTAPLSAFPVESQAASPASFSASSSQKSAVDSFCFVQRMNDLGSEIHRNINQVRMHSTTQRPTKLCNGNGPEGDPGLVHSSTGEETTSLETRPPSGFPTSDKCKSWERLEGGKQTFNHRKCLKSPVFGGMPSISLLPLHPGWSGMAEISNRDVKITKEQKRVLSETSAWYIPIQHTERDSPRTYSPRPNSSPPPTTPISDSSEKLDWSPTPPLDQMPPDSSAIRLEDPQGPTSSPQNNHERIHDEESRSSLLSQYSRQHDLNTLADAETTQDETDALESDNDQKNTIPTTESGTDSEFESKSEAQPPIIDPSGHTPAQKYGILGSQNIILKKKRQEERRKRKLSGELDTDEDNKSFTYQSPEPYYGETSSDELEKRKQTLKQANQAKVTASKQLEEVHNERSERSNSQIVAHHASDSESLSPLFSPKLRVGEQTPLTGGAAAHLGNEPHPKLNLLSSRNENDGSDDSDDEILQAEQISPGRYQSQAKSRDNIAPVIDHSSSEGSSSYDSNGCLPRVSTSRGRRAPLTSCSSRAFECHSCNQCFKCREHLKHHKLTVHMKEVSFSCEICNKGFSRRDNLSSHMRIHRSGAKPTGDIGVTDSQKNLKLQSRLGHQSDALNDDELFTTADEGQHTDKSTNSINTFIQSLPSQLGLEKNQEPQNESAGTAVYPWLAENKDHWDGPLTHKTFLGSQGLPSSQAFSPICRELSSVESNALSPIKANESKMIVFGSDDLDEAVSKPKDIIPEESEPCTQRRDNIPVVLVKETPYALLKNQKAPMQQSPSETVIRGTASQGMNHGRGGMQMKLSDKTQVAFKRKYQNDGRGSIDKPKKRVLRLDLSLSQDDPPVDLEKMVQEQKKRALSFFEPDEEGDRPAASQGNITVMKVETKMARPVSHHFPDSNKSLRSPQSSTTVAGNSTIQISSNDMAFFSSSNSDRLPQAAHMKSTRVRKGLQLKKKQATSVRLLGEILARETKKNKRLTASSSTIARNPLEKPLTLSSDVPGLQQGAELQNFSDHRKFVPQVKKPQPTLSGLTSQIQIAASKPTVGHASVDTGVSPVSLAQKGSTKQVTNISDGDDEDDDVVPFRKREKLQTKLASK